MNTEFTNNTVGEIVANDYRTAFVFKSFGIDFCCGGKRSISDVCAAKNIPVENLFSKIEEVMQTPNSGNRFNQWSADFLVGFIMHNHHKYVLTTLPELMFLAEKVSRVHGEAHPELHEMRELVFSLNSELRQHLEKEEAELFPAVTALAKGELEKVNHSRLISELEDEHDLAGSLMHQLEDLSDGFTPPEGACTSYKIYFNTLKEFQEDLHLHVHLENNVLFPKVMKLVNSEC